MEFYGFNVLMTIYVVVLFIILTPGVLISLPLKASRNIKAVVHGLLFAALYHLTQKTVYDYLNVEGFKAKLPTCKKGFDLTSNHNLCCKHGYEFRRAKGKHHSYVYFCRNKQGAHRKPIPSIVANKPKPVPKPTPVPIPEPDVVANSDVGAKPSVKDLQASLEAQGKVVVFRQPNYQGDSYVFTDGWLLANMLTTMVNGTPLDNTVKSIILPAGVTAELYDDLYWEGKMIYINKSVSDLSKIPFENTNNNWSNRIGSVWWYPGDSRPD